MRHILVANRGEIAVRVLRAARAAGYETSAVYSEADADAPHVRLAEHAVCLGPAAVRESYLSVERVLAAARETGADAIHPGYGMLAESAAFARACERADLTFIGPRADTIALMADKGAARRAAAQAGLPCVPGYDGDDQGLPTMAAEAGRIGFPLMVKAAAGGGGRGMRQVDDPAQLASAIERARAEAEAAFGDGRLILELAVAAGRHVEVQVVADAHGHVVHLGERDCSVQRRYQKLIEESPSPAVDARLRARLGTAAVSLSRACDYRGVGTVEFLLGADGHFYFLEMNTRLQVEHAVTEYVANTDLVLLQFDIAEGRPLPFSQGEVALRGHAAEARLCAEDPAQDFLPQAGRVLRFRPPDAALARTDHALCDDQIISSHYDSMVAKVIAHGVDRVDALKKLDRALAQVALFGVAHNRDYLRAVLAHPVFASGQATTVFVAEHGPAPRTAAACPRVVWAVAAFIVCEGAARAAGHGELCGFTNAQQNASLVDLALGDTSARIAVIRSRRPARWTVMWGQEVVTLDAPGWSQEQLSITCDGARRRFDWLVAADGALHLQDGSGDYRLENRTHTPAKSGDASGSGRIVSGMEAAVVQVDIAAGAHVVRGQQLLVLEAMKLQHPVVADVDGHVTAVHTRAGAQVAIGQLLVEID